MATTASAKKRIRSSARRREQNRVFRSRPRTFIKKTDRLIGEGKLEEAAQAARQAMSALDKAAVKGVIHKNNAARRKARLMRRLNLALKKAE
ncbi:MAG TPA: 30S ribosomal protein S20 [Chloroflexi bacterium]|nr:30S ribosomal protein S20 [Chloroflexota bacterium]